MTSKTFLALNDISFDVMEGERIGIIGHNGSGKSTLLKILSRIVYPTTGEVRIRGRVTSLLEVGTGFNPNLTGRENIFINASVQGLSTQETKSRLDDIIQFSGVGKFLDMPVKFYSSGMRARLGFSVAAHLDPDILLLDEVLSVGDVAFRNKCLNKMENLTGGGRTVLFVSHSTGSILQFCERVIWIDHGQIRFDGDAVQGIAAYEEANMAAKSPLDISNHTERRGSGMARFHNIAILDANGQPCESVRTGDDLYIALEYVFDDEIPEEIYDLKVVLVVDSNTNHRLLAMPSDALDVDFTSLEPRGRFLFQLRHLPLMPGTYKLGMALHINRQLADKVTSAALLLVREGDFFGTGEATYGNYAPTIMDFNLTLDCGS